MVLGIGTDIIEIESIQKSIERNSRFVQRVFTENEINYCEKKTNKYQHYAVRFAAKEAMMKAIKTGWDKGVQWKHIEVINKAGGGADNNNLWYYKRALKKQRNNKYRGIFIS